VPKCGSIKGREDLLQLFSVKLRSYLSTPYHAVSSKNELCSILHTDIVFLPKDPYPCKSRTLPGPQCPVLWAPEPQETHCCICVRAKTCECPQLTWTPPWDLWDFLVPSGMPLGSNSWRKASWATRKFHGRWSVEWFYHVTMFYPVFVDRESRHWLLWFLYSTLWLFNIAMENGP
jgi:hypothetical protein